MRNSKLVLLILLLFVFAVIGAGCGEEKIDWPEYCQNEVELPQELDEGLIFPGAICVSDTGLYGEGILDLAFCAKAKKQEVLEWYKQELDKRGYEHWYDEEYAKDEYLWQKGEAYIILNLPYTQSGEFIRFMLTVK